MTDSRSGYCCRIVESHVRNLYLRRIANNNLWVTLIELYHPCDPDLLTAIEDFGGERKVVEIFSEDYSTEVALVRIVEVQIYVVLIRLVGPNDRSFDSLDLAYVFLCI